MNDQGHGHRRIAGAIGACLLLAALGPRLSPGANGFDLAMPINSNAMFDSERDARPIAVGNGAGLWIALWNSRDPLDGTLGTDGDIFYAVSIDDARSWLPTRALNSNAATDSGDDGGPLNPPWLATDRAGVWLAVWDSTEPLGGSLGPDRDILFSRSTNNGSNWTPVAVLNSNAALDAFHDSAPVAETDGAGTWVVVWESQDDLGGTIGNDSDVLAARSTNGGVSWSPTFAINGNAATDSGRDNGPRIRHADGTWVVVWHTTDRMEPLNLDIDEDTVFARSTDGGASWSGPELLKTTSASDGPLERDFYPVVDSDGAGRWIAAWYSSDPLGGTIGTDSDILIARSDNDATTWTAPIALTPSYAASDTGADTVPAMTTNRAGEWVVVWESTANVGGIGTDVDILVSRSSNNGLSWSTPGRLNSSAPSDSFEDLTPLVAHGGGPGDTWVATWWAKEDATDLYGDDHDAYFSRSGDLDAPAGDAAFLSDTIPATLVVGQEIPYTVRVQNVGQTSWANVAGHRLAVVDDSCGVVSFPRLNLAPGIVVDPVAATTYDFAGTLTAPATTGECTLAYRMVHENVAFFGPTYEVAFEVVPRKVNDSYVVSHTIPTFALGGSAVPFSVTVRNIGTATWSAADGYKLATTLDPCDVAPFNRLLLADGAMVPPNSEVVFTGTLEMPDANQVCSVGFRMVREFVEFFGPTVGVDIRTRRNSAEAWSAYE